jgi:hypothetical protein
LPSAEDNQLSKKIMPKLPQRCKQNTTSIFQLPACQAASTAQITASIGQNWLADKLGLLPECTQCWQAQQHIASTEDYSTDRTFVTKNHSTAAYGCISVGLLCWRTKQAGNPMHAGYRKRQLQREQPVGDCTTLLQHWRNSDGPRSSSANCPCIHQQAGHMPCPYCTMQAHTHRKPTSSCARSQPASSRQHTPALVSTASQWPADLRQPSPLMKTSACERTQQQPSPSECEGRRSC